MKISALSNPAKRVVTLFAALLTLFSSLVFAVPVDAESGSEPVLWACGSYTLCKNGGYRPYLEYYTCGSSPTTAEIIRKTFINVYMKAGERIALGSSVHNSQLDMEDNSGGSDCDIIIIEPDGTKISENVVQNADGHIASVAQETAGPNVDGLNPGGFTPIYYTAEKEGIYQVRFHSYNGDSSNNPGPKKTTDAWSQSNATIAAWNVTVLSADNKVQPGRIYTKCLALNMGSNSGVALNSNVYVVTSDGYIYNTEFNGMNPFGFIFFANNRGLVSTTTNYSLYQSFSSKDNQLSDLKTQGATYQNPWSTDTDMDKTFSIFFDPPAPELEGILYPIAYEPETAKNLAFVGSKGDNSTHVGCGGYFRFEITSATSATITIDLTNVRLGDGTYADFGKVKLNNAVAPGTNYFYWNGCGEDGTPIPVGTYDNSSIQATVETYSGEYHFPLFDVEAAPNGIKVTRINDMYSQQIDADGNKVKVNEKYEANKSVIFYDNAARKGISPANPANHIADDKNAAAGVDSTDGVMKFNVTGSNYWGDRTALDIWTHSNNGEPLTAELTTPIVITDDYFTTLSGRIFFDQTFTAGAADSLFTLSEHDYVLENIEVQLSYAYIDTEGISHTVNISTTTDSFGCYFFAGIPVMENGSLTNCTVTVIEPVANCEVTTDYTTTNASLTTGTKTQNVSLGGIVGGNLSYSPKASLSDVGFHYDLYDGAVLSVNKVWSDASAQDPLRPGSVTVTAVGSYDGTEYIRIDAALSASNNWTTTFTGLPKYVPGTSDVLSYEVVEASDYYSVTSTHTLTDGGSVMKYTFTNTERYLAIEKQLEKAADRDTDFLFYVEADTDGTAGTDSSFYCVVTVPAGATSAQLQVRHLLAGAYTVTELNSEWRYTEVVAEETRAEDGGVTQDSAADQHDKDLNMEVDQGAYLFCFKNKKTEAYWLDDHKTLINTMEPIS